MKAHYKLFLIIYAILTAAVLGSNIYLLCSDFTVTMRNVVRIADVVLVLFTVYYVVAGFKKPHGNLLKILMLAFTLSIMNEALRDASDGWMLHAVLDILSIICIAYAVGRLDNVNENRILMPLIVVLLFAARVVLDLVCAPSASLLIFLGRCSKLIVWLDLSSAYFLRYNAQKEEGLSDAPRK